MIKPRFPIELFAENGVFNWTNFPFEVYGVHLYILNNYLTNNIIHHIVLNER